MEKIKQKKILEILHDIKPEFNFQESLNFIQDGLLDSFDIITLVSDLERSYSISIEGTDIIPENFKNIEGIQNLLTRYGIH